MWKNNVLARVHSEHPLKTKENMHHLFSQKNEEPSIGFAILRVSAVDVKLCMSLKMLT